MVGLAQVERFFNNIGELCGCHEEPDAEICISTDSTITFFRSSVGRS